MEQETSRERVRKTFNHQQPDRLAVDFGSSTSTGISIFAYARLQEYLHADPGELPKLYELFLMMADPSETVLNRLGSDVVQLKRYAPEFDIPLTDWKPYTLYDGTQCLVPGGFAPKINERGDMEILDEEGNCVVRMPEKGFYFDQILYPYKDIVEPEEIDGLKLPRMTDAEVEYLKRESKRLYEETDKAVMFPIYARTFEAGMRAWGMEEWLILIMTGDKTVHRYLDKITDIYIEDMDRVLAHCDPYIDFIRFCDDFGTQDSLIVSPQVFRSMFKPYLKKMFDFIKEKYPKQKIALHSCGSIKPLIPDLIEIGVDILNPVQISAANMNPVELKEEFGQDLVFWGGGCDMQSKAIQASIDELKDHVYGLIETFAPGGGFLFAPTHNIQADITPGRICAIYEAAGRYR